MNIKTNFIMVMLLIFLIVISKPLVADSANDTNTQTNTSGSNTNITGGYTATTTNNTDGQTNTTTSTTTNTTTSNGSAIPVNTSNSPSYSSMSQDVCSSGASIGVQTFGVGVSGGKHFRDLNCERIKLSKVLYDFGMKVGAVALLCQDERVFEAMINAGTPCPIDGKIGKEAMLLWKKYDHERPDYDTYIKRMKKRKVINKKEAAKLELHTR